MNKMDSFYMERPTSGVRTMCSRLGDKGYAVRTKHARSLNRLWLVRYLDEDKYIAKKITTSKALRDSH